MPAWDSNAYLRRLHRATLRAVLLCLAAVPAWLLLGAWLGDHDVWIVGGVIAGIFVLYAAWHLPALLDPRRHASFRALAAYGDPEQVAQALAVEIARGGQTVLGVTVGREWMLIPSFARLDAVRPADVMWTYPKVTTTRYYGVIPVNRRHDAIIVTRGRQYTVNGKEKTVHELIRTVHHAAPWAHVGYTDRLSVLFERRNRETTFGYVDSRREQMLAGG
ncbi:DUF6709 family protein [Longimicrobium sp.]|uniref:DUF6709 family protein n=1 Tax=Longimicrobium sp. TaxID=2029185 RepID=UPI002C564824|nr:DUF6709 family protein [Longimicrobium sp.]HSU15117.1 DUF6709 family protein [Longimicrobium sp.]